MRLPLVLAALLLSTACEGDPATSSGSGGPGDGSSGGGDGAGGATSGTTAVGGSSSGSGATGTQASGSGGADAGDGGATGAGGGPDDPACPRVRVVLPPGSPLNVRPDPSTAGAPVGTLDDGAIVEVVAMVEGEAIDGVSLWYEITSPAVSGFVFSAYAECTEDEVPDLLPGFYLPLECGTSATISQGNESGFSHTGQAAYAFDFALGVGVPMVAMDAGVVAYADGDTGPGDPCYDGGDSSCIAEANYVTLRHADGTMTSYAHLSQVLVQVGQAVARGERIGLSGSTGWSTGPHAHVERETDCGYPFCQSIPLEFVEAGVPVAGQVVTSMNCP